MDLFNGIGRPMMRLVEKDLFVWFGNLFPYGGGWRIFAMGLFTLIAAAILAGITIWLLLVHSRNEHIRKVTVPFRFMYWIAGIMFGIMTLVDPDGGWNVAWHIAFVLGFAATCGLLHVAIEKMENPPRSKRYYWCIGLSFALEMFLVGFYAFTVFIIAIIFSIIIIVCLFVFGAGIVGMTQPPPPCPRDGGMRDNGKQRVRLDDGTLIEDGGLSWYEVGGNRSYHKNLDGTFTRE